MKVSSATQTNHVYQVQARPDLASGTWTNLAVIMPGNGSPFFVTNAYPPGVTKQFFRVLASH